MKPIFAALAVTAALAGCSTAPATPAGTPGAYPSQHHAIFSRHLAATLKDPATAQVRHVAGPAPYAREAVLFAPALHGWASCYAVNAKNSFGGYTGAKSYIAVFRDGALVDVMIEDAHASIFTLAAMTRFCNSAGHPDANAR